jgi:metallo-beta-lactamase family protein
MTLRRQVRAGGVKLRSMHLQFLGAATTVTGSQFLLTTERARVLIDCGMFQGSPNEAIRNRIPLAYEPDKLDAILLTHAHLDHCGLIPHVVKEGFRGSIWATRGTVELAGLVLLDSGKLQEEFAKRGARWEKRNPERAADEDRRDQAAYEAAVALAQQGDLGGAVEQGVGSIASGEHVPTSVEPTGRPPAAPDRRVGPDPRPDPAHFGRRRYDAALLIPQEGGGAEDPVVAPTTSVSSAVLPAEPDVPPGFVIAPDPETALRAQPPRIELDLDEPLYDERDARASLGLFRGLDYDQEIEVAPGVHATFVDAGHILGSAIIRLRVSERDGGPERRIVFSGDLGRPGTPILRDPTVVTDADYVLVESTYGGREHEPEGEAIRILAETVRLVAEHNGVLLVPSFAIGRTQEVVWELDRLISAGEIPLLPLYLDSPMASKASDIYRAHPDYYDEETRELLARDESPLDYPNQIITNDVRQSQAIQHAKRPYMIVASNGMLTGGRVVGHLRNLIDDPAAVLLFVGYQGQGTLGAHLQAGATTVKIDGQVRQVRCQIRSISGFSAHADESELLDWLGNFARGKRPGDAGFPRTVFLVHGDPDAQQALLPKVRGLGFEANIPSWHQVVELD